MRKSSRTPIEQRFWPKVRKTKTCWLWTASTDKKGYGWIGLGGHIAPRIYSHRLSWEIHNGKVPDGLFVLHDCDVPLCVRPDHLFLGTKSDNTRDMVSKGRHPSQKYPGLQAGENNGYAKLTNRQAEEIRQIYARGGISQEALGRRFGVVQTTISRIVLNKNYI
jgi:HNH endonuclease/CENP-B-like protein